MRPSSGRGQTHELGLRRPGTCGKGERARVPRVRGGRREGGDDALARGRGPAQGPKDRMVDEQCSDSRPAERCTRPDASAVPAGLCYTPANLAPLAASSIPTTAVRGRATPWGPAIPTALLCPGRAAWPSWQTARPPGKVMSGWGDHSRHGVRTSLPTGSPPRADTRCRRPSRDSIPPRRSLGSLSRTVLIRAVAGVGCVGHMTDADAVAMRAPGIPTHSDRRHPGRQVTATRLSGTARVSAL